MTKRIHTVARPYMLTFFGGGSYPIGSEDAQRLIDEYPIVRATKSQVQLRADDGRRCQIYPATIGGGPAFEIEEGES